MNNILPHVQYVRRGYAIVPVPRKSKAPIIKCWQNLRISEIDIPKYFNDAASGNVGIILGAASGGLVDVDLDCAEAVEVADRLLPPTGAITGHPDRPRSHRWYKCDMTGIKKFADPFAPAGEKATVVEIRGGGGQTLVGPSVHPDTGKQYDILDGEPAEITPFVLETSVKAIFDEVIFKRHGLAALDSMNGRDISPDMVRREGETDSQLEKRARAYVRAIPEAVAGQHGHGATYSVARKLTRGFCLPESVALDILKTEYNPRCAPPWSDKELEHKIRDAKNKPCLLADGWIKDKGHEQQQPIAKFPAAKPVESPGNPIITVNDPYPPIVDAKKFLAEEILVPPEIIWGVLHKGGKLIYGGPSKTFKSWSLIDLCCSVATGMPWLGMETTLGRALYINFELQNFAVQKRIAAILKAKGVELADGAFDIWNLRGYSCPMTRLIDSLLRQIDDRGYSLITVDPIYKTLDGRDENSAGDIAQVCNEIESVTVKTEAACAWGAHYAKGNASGKSHLDRMSGSGVWARDPDAILTATAHEIENTYTVDMTLRNFPPQPQFCVRWEYPLMVRDNSDPSKLRQQGVGGIVYSERDLFASFADGMNSVSWQKACSEACGMSRSTFFSLKCLAESSNKIIQHGKTFHYPASNA